MNRRKTWLGGATWLALLAMGAAGARLIDEDTRYALDRTQTECWRSLIAPSPQLDVRFPPGTHLELGNGVFATVGGELRRVGEVQSLRQTPQGIHASLLLDSAHDLTLTAHCRAIRRSEGRSFLFATKTLLPEEKWNLIEQEWQAFSERHARAIYQALEPALAATLEDAAVLLGEELQVALQTRQADLRRVLERHQLTITEERLIPLFKQEVWPIATRHGAQPLESIGRQIWDRTPLFALAWRAAFDRVMEDRPVKLEERWKTFLKEEAIPILERNEGQILGALEQTLRDLARSEAVREEVRNIAELLIDDPDLRQIGKEVLRDLLLNNARLRNFLGEQWDNPQLRMRLEQVNRRLQVFLDRVGNLLFLDHTGEGINPDLARVLRIFLLRRDQQYVFLEWNEGPPLQPKQVLVGSKE